MHNINLTVMSVQMPILGKLQRSIYVCTSPNKKIHSESVTVWSDYHNISLQEVSASAHVMCAQ
jgi:hypothetical protein